MSFASESQKKDFQLNLVLSLDGTFYSQYPVDSDTTDIIGTGSGIDADKVGIVDKVRINPIKVDIRNVRTTTQTASFSLLDKDAIITTQISLSDTSLMETEAILYVGFVASDAEVAFDMQDYLIISRTRVKTARRRPNMWEFTAAEPTDLMNEDMFTTFDSLDGSITDSDTTITLNDATNFPTTGRALIEDEVVVWSGKSGNDLTGVTRGADSSTAAAHDDETQVDLVTRTSDTNPITLMLQLMISPGGGGSFDVLDDGLGIAESLVDTTSFTDIRDDTDNGLSTRQVRFDLVQVGKGLKFIESEICLPTNTRLFNKDGKIALAVLDQANIGEISEEITEDSIVGTPGYQLSADRVANRIIVNTGFSLGAGKFTRSTEVEDTDSQTDFGRTTTLTFNFKGLQNDIGGENFADNFADRLLERVSTPRASISMTTHFDQIQKNIGDKVDVIHRYLPKEGGGLGSVDGVEILSKAVNFDTGQVKFDLQFTSYAGLRLGLIAPSPLPTAVTSQTVFTVPDGDCYRAGDKLRLWNDTTSSYFTDPVNTVDSVSGNVITMVDAWTTTLNTTTTRIKIADYDQASDFQQGRYSFVGNNGSPTGFFDDGTKSYQIAF